MSNKMLKTILSLVAGVTSTVTIVTILAANDYYLNNHINKAGSINDDTQANWVLITMIVCSAIPSILALKRLKELES